MISKEGIDKLQERLETTRAEGATFFNNALKLENERRNIDGILDDLGITVNKVRTRIKQLSVDIAGAARGSALIAEADLQDLRHNTRRMLASVSFNSYHHYGVYVHHNEDVVLGVDPPSQFQERTSVQKAFDAFNTAATGLSDLISLLSPSDGTTDQRPGSVSYRPNTAFIMMAIDKAQPGLEDVKQAIKDVCKEFGIAAITSDEIEHEGTITERVLEEIETSEFLIADLTHERPNVYYELGHAHARNKRVVLYRKGGTKLHFDIAHRNCPEYENVTNLKEQLRRRLEIATNRPKKQ